MTLLDNLPPGLENDPFLERIKETLAARRTAETGRDDDEALRLESSFIDFVESAWPSIDPSEFQNNWAVSGLAAHLEAVAAGHIRRLILNIPPRCSKTILSSVCFPAWIWAQRQRTMLTGSQVKFICGSYGHGLSLMNSNLCRRLIMSPWYQQLWGHRFTLRADQNTKLHFDTSTGGQRIAASVGSALLGIGGDVVIVDDPHNTQGIESEAERETVWRWFSELSSTRLNSPRDGAVIVVMQRLSGEDFTGRLLYSDGGSDYTHFMVPLEFEADTTSQALGYLRRTGRIQTDEEVRMAMADDVRHQPQRNGSTMSSLETVMREVAPDYYFLQPVSTRSGVRAFVDDMFDILLAPGLVPRAREAAQACEAEPVTNPNAFQEKLRAAVFDLYRRTVRPHPRIDDMAAAFADTIIAPFTWECIETALRRAERLSAASEHLWEVERAREREAEIARNRRRPRRKPLYDC